MPCCPTSGTSALDLEGLQISATDVEHLPLNTSAKGHFV